MTPSICLYTESEEPSGMGRQMLMLAAELRHHYQLSFVCPPTVSGLELLHQAAMLGLPTFALHDLDQLRQWHSEHPFDLLHNHAGIGWEGQNGVYLSRSLGVPCVVRTEHLPYLLTDHEQQASHRWLTTALDRLVCVSHGAQASFEAAGVDPKLLCVVRNGVLHPVVRGNPDRVRRQLGLPEAVQLLLTVGRFMPQKGYQVLLDAVPAVLADHPKTHWLWVGTGWLYGEMEQRIKERGLTDYIHLLGQRDDVPTLMAAANMLVLPSLFEGLPLVVLEAMALGLPIVGTDVCGTADVIRDGLTGCLVPPQNAPALAEAICGLLQDHTGRLRLGANARAEFHQHWTASRMAADMSSVYEEVLSQRLPRSQQVEPVRRSRLAAANPLAAHPFSGTASLK